MKIDLTQLKEVEKSIQDYPVSLEALKLMVQNVLNFQDTSFRLAPNNVKAAIDTLVELKILILDQYRDLPIQQLNS